ncbi:MAG: hypothetical protein QME83_09375 [Thermodesulfobacteriota bacterium]|nr:hypothetical protein [Thermodesulfobacteriota bacterium]
MMLLLKQALRVWLTGLISIAVAGGCFFSYPTMVGATNTAHEAKTPLDCLKCHTRSLRGHDKLGTGNEACWACHDSRTIGKLILNDGTKILMADSNRLCKDCHPEYYKAWNKGKHGVLPGINNGMTKGPGGKRPKCVGCHSAHQPKIKLLKGAIPQPPSSSGPGGPLDCVSCHSKVLEGHDKLGAGSKSCWVCHYDVEMGAFHLPGKEERLKKADFPQLCAQCHFARYQEWIAGTHGIPAWEMGSVDVHGALRVGCNGCHDPHQPQVVYFDITIAHPSPQSPPTSPSPILFFLLGAALLLIIATVISKVRKEEWP